MTQKNHSHLDQVKKQLHEAIVQESSMHDQICWEVESFTIVQVASLLKKHGYEQLIDLCVVDYSAYGQTEWKTNSASSTGFSRAVGASNVNYEAGRRFAVVYQLLSLTLNHRLCIKVFLPEHRPMLDSVMGIWPSADWYEREAFDLFGVVFSGHPDLRRLLTDYGFVGHPFRKDFPLSGHVQMRYDAPSERVIYEKVDIDPRVTTPRVIRHDNRYLDEE